MHTRRLCSLLLGAWLAGSLFMVWVATHNLGNVDPMMANPGMQAQRHIRDIGPDRVRMLMRFQAGELNRYYFETWEVAEIILGIVLAVTLLFATNGNRLMMALAGGMIAIPLIQHFTITPQILELGRGLDFATPDQMQAERQSFWGYHNFYSMLEIVKIALGFGLAARLLISMGNSTGRRRRSSSKIDSIDDANDGHVNG